MQVLLLEKGYKAFLPEELTINPFVVNIKSSSDIKSSALLLSNKNIEYIIFNKDTLHNAIENISDLNNQRYLINLSLLDENISEIKFIISSDNINSIRTTFDYDYDLVFVPPIEIDNNTIDYISIYKYQDKWRIKNISNYFNTNFDLFLEKEYLYKINDSLLHDYSIKNDSKYSNIKNSVNTVYESIKNIKSFEKIKDFSILPTTNIFLSLPELLKWSESITKGTATIYDKALDMNYLKTHIGGGNHRMFDGGHDLLNAWLRVREVAPDDNIIESISGYIFALWKDVTTIKGLPFVTWDKDTYNLFADYLTKNISFIDKKYVYDLCSYDIFELIGASLGVINLLFHLNKDEQKKFYELIGQLGVTSIASANPLMALIVIFSAAYTCFVQKKKVDFKGLSSGSTSATISLSIFSLLGLPIFIKFGIAILITNLIKKQVFDNEKLSIIISEQMSKLKISSIEFNKLVLKKIKGEHLVMT